MLRIKCLSLKACWLRLCFFFDCGWLSYWIQNTESHPKHVTVWRNNTVKLMKIELSTLLILNKKIFNSYFFLTFRRIMQHYIITQSSSFSNTILLYDKCPKSLWTTNIPSRVDIVESNYIVGKIKPASYWSRK